MKLSNRNFFWCISGEVGTASPIQCSPSLQSMVKNAFTRKPKVPLASVIALKPVKVRSCTYIYEHSSGYRSFKSVGDRSASAGLYSSWLGITFGLC